MALVTDGLFRYRTARTERMALPGALIVGNAGEPFEAEHCDPNGNKRLLIFLDEDLLEEVARAEKLDASAFGVSALPPGRRSALMCAWIRLLHVRRHDELAYALVGRLLRARFEPSEWKPAASAHAAVREALLYIRSNFREPCPLATLAGVSGMSRYHFLRSFTRLAGITPHQYLLHVRLVEAAETLARSSEPVIQVALSVGFEDLSQFYRQFRRRFGVPPSRWRAMH